MNLQYGEAVLAYPPKLGLLITDKLEWDNEREVVTHHIAYIEKNVPFTH